MNYRHLYHAGNFADVFKHIILVLLIESLQQKASGFCYIDAHGGRGLYDLTSEAAQKSKEFDNGIISLFHSTPTPTLVDTYLNIIRSFQDTDEITQYPGSPLIALALLGEQDSMILNEWHPEEYRELKALFFNTPHVHLHHRDAHEFLPAVLPPTPRRGLILIDPPYEKKEEFDHLLLLLPKLLKRFSSGIYALWYPIKTQEHRRFLKKCQHALSVPYLTAEIVLSDDDSDEQRLIGCGMQILNPPWKIEEKIKLIGNYLWSLWSPEKKGYFRLTVSSHR